MRTFASLLCLVLMGTASATASLQSHQEIRDAAAEFLTRQTSDSVTTPRISVARPDTRLRLVACELPLETFLPPGARPHGNVAVGIRCNGVNRWTIYLSASVREFHEVVVLTRSVPRGVLFEPDDLRVEMRDTTAVRGGYVRDPDRVIGMLSRRSLSAGSVLKENALEAPDMVKRGQQVVVVARTGSLEVRSSGKALADGAEGDLVRVRNAHSDRIVQALVTGPGTVAIPF